MKRASAGDQADTTESAAGVGVRPDRRHAEASDDLDALRDWVQQLTGASVTRWQRASTGGSRETYLVDVVASDASVTPLVLRAEAGGSFTGTEISVAKEAVAYRALAGTPVPVPRVHGVAPDGAALLMERVPGSGDFSSLGEAEQHELLNQLVDLIAELHNVPVESMELPGYPQPRTPEEHATLDLGLWARLGKEGVPDLDPLIRYAGAYLRAHPPTTVSRTVFVQGDTGPGNFVADQGRITALVDMEFSHLGDPMDDIAWMLYRTATTGLDLRASLPRYSDRTGIPIDERSVDFYQLAVQYRCAVTTSLAVARGGGARGLAPYLLVTQRYLLGIAEHLSSYLGVVNETLVLPDAVPTERTTYFDHLLEGIRSAVRAIEEPGLREATRNLQIFVHYLRAHDLAGSQLAEQDAADRQEVLEVAPDDDQALGNTAEKAGASGDKDVLRYLLRRSQRQSALWRTLLERPRR